MLPFIRIICAFYRRYVHCSDCSDSAIKMACNGFPSMSSTNCWNSAKCERADEQCFVLRKTAAAGLAHCRKECPSSWLCETRVPDGSGAACGPAPLGAQLQAPSAAMHSILSGPRWQGLASICDRRNPPPGPQFEISCYDGGQTGNRYMMVKYLLMRAAMCAGVALMPPEYALPEILTADCTRESRTF